MRLASLRSTRGCEAGTGSSGSPPPRRCRRCARSTPIYGPAFARSCCATGNAPHDRTQPHPAGRQARERVGTALLGTEVLVGAEPHARRRSGPAQPVLRRARADLPGRHRPSRVPADRRSPVTAAGAAGMIRGRQTGRRGGHNPPSRRAVYDQRTYGSVGAGAGDRPGYPSDGAVGVHGLPAPHRARTRHSASGIACGQVSQRQTFVLGAETLDDWRASSCAAARPFDLCASSGQVAR